MLTINIQTTGNPANRLAALADIAGRRKYLTAVARTAANTFVQNFEDLAQQRHRDGPFNYYHTAARNTIGVAEKLAAVIRITAPAGIGLRRYGGDVYPSGRISSITGKPITKLAIPVKGRPMDSRTPLDAKNMGVKLRLAVIKRLGIAALVGPDPATGRPRFYFWLVSSTHHDPDPTVFPSADTLSRSVNKTLARVFNDAWRKGYYHVTE